MQCSAVEEEDPVQVENNLRDARCDLFQASLEWLTKTSVGGTENGTLKIGY